MTKLKCSTQQSAVSDKNRFWSLMTTPLREVSDEDLEWASRQNGLNSHTSMSVWKAEINRRINKKKARNTCSTQRQT